MSDELEYLTDEEQAIFDREVEMRTLPNPYLASDFDGRQDFDIDTSLGDGVERVAPRSTDETAAFLRQQAQSGSTSWRAMCLKLQRMARGLPAVYPSALSAAIATPEEDRVYKEDNLRRGMVGFSDDPNDGNPYGHVYFIAGRSKKSGEIITWTNDARISGGVSMVQLGFYERKWGDKFQFGATSLNGYDFAEFNKPPKPKYGSLGENFDEAIQRLRAAISYHDSKGHSRLVRMLRVDLRELRGTKRELEQLKNN